MLLDLQNLPFEKEHINEEEVHSKRSNIVFRIKRDHKRPTLENMFSISIVITGNVTFFV